MIYFDAVDIKCSDGVEVFCLNFSSRLLGMAVVCFARAVVGFRNSVVCLGFSVDCLGFSVVCLGFSVVCHAKTNDQLQCFSIEVL